MEHKKQNAELLLESLHEVLQDLEGQKKLNERVVSLEDIDVFKIREKYHMTQLEFSKMFGFSLRTLQQWEQGRRKPQGSVRVLLKVIDYAPEVVERALHH